MSNVKAQTEQLGETYTMLFDRIRLSVVYLKKKMFKSVKRSHKSQIVSRSLGSVAPELHILQLDKIYGRFL